MIGAAPPRDFSARHVLALDGLRGIAILLVMTSHLVLLAPADAPIVSQVARIGWVGVDLFFVLSGFLITGILIDGEGRSGWMRHFYLRRAVRILPLYYVMAILAFVVVPHTALWPGDDPARFATTGSGEIWYWILLPNVAIDAPGIVQSKIMSVSWSVAIEEHFYLLWPLILSFLRPRWRMTFALAVALASLVLRCALLLVVHVDALRLYVMTPTHLDGIAAGCFLGLAVRRYANWSGLYRAASAASVVGGCVFLGLVVVGRSTAFDGKWMSAFGYGAAAICFMGVVGVAWLRSGDGSVRDRVLSSKLLRMFGKYSYCLYFINLPVQSIVRDHILTHEVAMRFPGGMIVGQLAFGVLVIMICLIVAMFSWRVLERPFLSLVPGHAGAALVAG